MTHVDSLLYRPWSDDTRRGVSEQPVDFSKKSNSAFCTTSEPEGKFTDIEEVSASESDEYTQKDGVFLKITLRQGIICLQKTKAHLPS